MNSAMEVTTVLKEGTLPPSYSILSGIHFKKPEKEAGPGGKGDIDGKYIIVKESKKCERQRLREEARSFNIIARDRKILDIIAQISNVASYHYPVHIYGETGTGKELIAEAIHKSSPRGKGPFVPVNCGALPEGLVSSELFGHVKGAFSGAVRNKKGRFELAHGGTIFLDEVADLSKHMQVKLLRVLQESRLEKVGGEKSIPVSVRVLSATNKDLREEIKKGNFREDLYYRINVVPFKLPPLRKRKGDIPLLADYFLDEATKTYRQKRVTLSEKAVPLLMEYRWPGNVRELQNTMQFAFVKCKGREITPEDLPPEITEGKSGSGRRGPCRKLDVDSVKNALEKTGGNKSKAAKSLGVGRATLYRFLDDYPDIQKRTK